MSVVNLPQETQTRKLKSLSGDLRGIAEELIAKKFDVKEEVVPEREPSFQGAAQCLCGRLQMGQSCPAHGSPISSGYGGYGNPTQMGGHPSDPRQYFQGRIQVFQAYVYSPSDVERVMVELMRQADMQNMRREGRMFRISRQVYDYLRMYSSRFMQGYTEGTLHKIMGCDVDVSNGYGGNPNEVRLEAIC